MTIANQAATAPPTSAFPSASAPSAASDAGEHAFNRDRYLLHQKHLAIDQKYAVFDEQGRQILFVKRRSYIFRNLLAVFAGLPIGLGVGIGSVALSLSIKSEPVQIAGCVIGIALSILAWIAIALLLAPKRHIEFCLDPNFHQVVMTVLQDKKVTFLKATYTAADANLTLLGWFRKNYLYDLVRKRWDVHSASGELLCVCMEDSVILSMMRRLLGGFYGLLRTNFVLLDPQSGIKLGEFNRKFTLLDKYVLDLTLDRERKVDRRLALALGVLLDTGEHR